MQDSLGGKNSTTMVLLHGSVTAKVRTGLFMRFRELTPMSNARHRRVDAATRLVDGASIRLGSLVLTFSRVQNWGSTQTELGAER